MSVAFAEWTLSLARAGAAVGIPPATSFHVLTFLMASLLNLASPSGGGQWKVQDPIVLAACRDLQIPLGRGVLLVAYGDELTNLVQPFWALALLGITGLRARDIMGYTAATMLLVTPLYLACILLL
ncbi:MAG: TIGR00366 family protein [Planctomycetes bacterium]|nr:TIGR00366 family protein [Planctomycetota bacterium]